MNAKSAVSILLQPLFLTLALFALAGCKVAVINVEGGEVQSIASGTCLAGDICLHPVTDTNYAETFTAVPAAGWTFTRWNSGGGFLCPDSAATTCLVTNVGTAGNPFIEAVVASDATFYLMPVFEQLPPKRIFVTSSASDGDLGGLAGADAMCQGDANNPDGTASWKALLGPRAIGEVMAPNTRYIRPDGTPIAITDGDAKLPGALQNSISTEFIFAWTGYVTDYYSDAGTSCNSWTTGSHDPFIGFLGQANDDGQSLEFVWLYTSGGNCDNVLRLYCVEQ